MIEHEESELIKIVEDAITAFENQDARESIQALVNSGIITPEGRLTNRYRGPGKYVRYTIEEEDEMRRRGELQVNDGE